MTRIDGYNSYCKFYGSSVRTFDPDEKTVERSIPQEAERTRSRDEVILSVDWKKETDHFLEQIRQEYPGIHLVIHDGIGDKASVPQMAEDLGNGTYLVVSRDFLKRMSSGSEDYLACRKAITDALSHLSRESGRFAGSGAVLEEHSVTYWSAAMPKAEDPFAVPQPAQPSAETGIFFSEQEVRVSAATSSYASAPTYARLAGASTKGQVRNVMGDAHRSIASLRLVIALGSDKEKAKARTAIGSLQKLLVRGSKKIKKLDEETLLKIRKKRAEKQKQQRKARQLKLEMEKKRVSRHSADGALRTEGILDDVNRRLRFYDDHERDSIPVSDIGMGMSIGAGMGGVQADISFSAADVVVTETAAI